MTSRSAATSGGTLRRYSRTTPLGVVGAGAIGETSEVEGGQLVGRLQAVGQRRRRRRCARSAPSIVQPGAGDGQGGEVERRRPGPRTAASGSTGTPRVASSARASSRRRTPCSPATSQATMAWGRSPRILPTCWVRTRPGPASTNTRTPAAYMDSTWSTKRTPAVDLLGQRGRPTGVGVAGGVGLGGDVGPHREGRRGDGRPRPGARPAARRPPAMSGLWKAQATGRSLALTPSASRAATAASTSAVGPDITAWRGPLWLATTSVGPGGQAVVELVAGQLRPRPWCRGRRPSARWPRGWRRPGPR